MCIKANSFTVVLALTEITMIANDTIAEEYLFIMEGVFNFTINNACSSILAWIGFTD